MKKALLLFSVIALLGGCIKVSEGLNEDPVVCYATNAYYYQLLKMGSLTSLRWLAFFAPANGSLPTVMDNNVVYLFDNGPAIIHAYGLKDAITYYWSKPYPLWSGQITDYPTIVNKIVYFGSSNGIVYAIIPDSVSILKWQFKTGDSVNSSPAVVNGIVYVGSNDGVFYALDAISGSLKWKFQSGGPIKSSPTVANGTVYFGSNDKKVYALDAVTGQKKWEYLTGKAVISSPAFADEELFAPSSDGRLYTLNGSTGAMIRSDSCGVTTASPTCSNGNVYLCCPGGIYVFASRANAAAAFTGSFYLKISNLSKSSVTIADGRLYVANDVSLFIIDAVTGRLISTYTDNNGVIATVPLVFYLRNSVKVDYSSLSGMQQ